MSEEDEGTFGDSLSDGLKARLADCIVNGGKGGTIYYIACPKTQRLKIGFTSGDPIKRLRALQTGSPTKLVLLAVHPGNMNDERFLHEEFASANLHGEWFDTDERVFECVSFVCWATALAALNKGGSVPHWAQVGLDALEEWLGVPLPLPILDRTAQ